MNIILSLIFAVFIVMVAGRMIIRRDEENIFVTFSLYFAAGTVVLSLYMLFLSVIWIKYSIPVISAPFLVYLAFIFPALLKRIKELKLPAFSPPAKPLIESFFFTVILIMLAIMLISLTVNNLVLPVFRADAIGGWVFKAKLFFFEKSSSLEIFKHKIFCYTADYPILVPLNLTWISICLGKWQDTTVRVFFCLQYLASLIIFYSLIRKKAPPLGSIAATLIVYTIPGLLTNAEIGYADFSLSLYVLLAVMYLLEWIRSKDQTKILLSAFFIGAAGFTKNDGIGLFMALTLVLANYLFWDILKDRTKIRSALTIMGVFLITATAVIAPYKLLTMYYSIKPNLAPTSSLLAQLMHNWARIPTTLGFFSYEFFSNAYTWLNFWICFFIFIFIKRIEIMRSELKHILFFIFASILIYTSIYLLVPPIYFEHIADTINRLLLGLAPAAGYLMFTAIFMEKEGNSPTLKQKL